VGVGAKLYRFNGIEHSEELGLDLAPFRSYDPAIGRWLQIDPMAENHFNLNPYNHVMNNPMSYSDPLGLDTIPAGVMGATATVTAQRDRTGDAQIDETGQRQCTNCPTVVTGDAGLQSATGSVVTARMSWFPIPGSVGGVEGVASFVPFYAPGRNALDDFQNDRYWSGGINAGIAISDAFLIRSILTGVARGGIGALSKGGLDWKRYRAYYGKSGFGEPNHALHHWLIQRNGPRGKYVPNVIKNQMWNLVRMPGVHPHCNIHKALHAGGPLKGWRVPITLYYGTPTYLKAAPGSIGGRFYLQD
jgi:RHS repeat-associated protein